jgi:hypothetical protein
MTNKYWKKVVLYFSNIRTPLQIPIKFNNELIFTDIKTNKVTNWGKFGENITILSNISYGGYKGKILRTTFKHSMNSKDYIIDYKFHYSNETYIYTVLCELSTQYGKSNRMVFTLDSNYKFIE